MTPHPTAEDLRDALGELLASRPTPLIVTHRGTPLGSFADNTLRAAVGAVRSGADMVEIDVIRSRDGEYFAFHNGYEKKQFGREFDVREMGSAELSELEYIFQGSSDWKGLQPIQSLLDGLPGIWWNIDRSWTMWPELLDVLAASGHAERLILKSPPQPEVLDALAAHPYPFLYFPMVRTLEELASVEARSGVNLVGAELLAEDTSAPFATAEAVRTVAARYPMVLLNALNLENCRPLYLGWDDEVSVLEDPDLGWGRLIDAGATAVQTDWPHLLRDYRAGRS